MPIPVGPNVLVKHMSWGHGKVVEVTGPHVTIYFPSLVGSTGGANRKLQLGASQYSVPDDQSDPVIDLPVAKTTKAKATRAKAKKTVPEKAVPEKTEVEKAEPEKTEPEPV